MKNITKEEITVVILAGGRSLRMGSDKGLINFAGKPLISYAVDVAYKKVSNVLISTNSNFDKYQQFGKVVIDTLKNFQGPLAGILAAMKEAKTLYLLVLPCDSPYVEEVLVDKLIKAMEKNDAKICMASDGVISHSLFALVKTNLKHNLSLFLQNGDNRVKTWFVRNNYQTVILKDCAKMFININNKNDLIKLTALANE